ncbi:MAG: Bpu10I family restriction endonuclease [Desulfobacterales bacterium]
MTEFTKPISQELLNIEDKNRSNLFTWRGQFSPQLIECLLKYYCPKNSVVLDPFAGSGTVLFESANMGFPAYGFEINPSAWSFCKLYEFANYSKEFREHTIAELGEKIENEFPVVLFSEDYLTPDEVEQRIIRIAESISERAKVLCNALIVLIDAYKNNISTDFIQSKFYDLAKLVRNLPCTEASIKADLQDARCLPLDNQSVDFVITSPPYINVFNYHQNYRRSVEILGWDVLKVAKSEIGSNRANRGNRFYTVVQYCIDMASTLQELARVLRPGGKAIFIVGYESKVLGVPFYNADIVYNISQQLGMFDLNLRQKRLFKNRFGQEIREDILNISRKAYRNGADVSNKIGQKIGLAALESAIHQVSAKNRGLLEQAILGYQKINGTPLFDGDSYSKYQTREYVMMVNDQEKEYDMSRSAIILPTPHLAKLKALINNRRLPESDRPRINEAFGRYKQWISDMESIKPGRKGSVQKLVDITNRYKMFIELELIFDSSEDFLYRQKGQLKLDNTILEEFLPQLMCRGLSLPENSYSFGPQKTFSGLSFNSGIANTGSGGQPSLRTKDQDFVLGKRLYMMTSFDKDFNDAECIETNLGYVCAECKTNLDKTMFQEAVATSRDLKMAVPSSLYFLVCEFLDMTPVSITSTHIDDVLIVRKTKRMPSTIRQEYGTADDRKSHRDEYINFLEAAKYHADVFQRMTDKIQAMADDSDPTASKVLKRGFF